MEAFDVIALFGMILASGALGLASDQAKKIAALQAELERLRSRLDELTSRP